MQSRAERRRHKTRRRDTPQILFTQQSMQAQPAKGWPKSSDDDDGSNLKVRLRPPSPPPSPRMLNSRPPGDQLGGSSAPTFHPLNHFVCLSVKNSQNNLMDFLLTRPVVPGGASIDNLLVFMLKMPMMQSSSDFHADVVVSLSILHSHS